MGMACEGSSKACAGFQLRSSASLLLAAIFFFTSHAHAQASDWQAQVRKFCEVQDWTSAMRIVEREIARAPQDLDVREWRARVLTWSGDLTNAEQEYPGMLGRSPREPAHGLGRSGGCPRRKQK